MIFVLNVYFTSCIREVFLALFIILICKTKLQDACNWTRYTKSIENGWIEQCGEYCQIFCDYGYITSDKTVFHCGDMILPSYSPDESYPECVRPMAFLIGKFINNVRNSYNMLQISITSSCFV